ncbi:MAG TPA: ABC transporter permease [Gemmatimonadales bacterium]|jgi:predicted permease|nr:ABC transporter permease [Gemmatimonadales bacterium]
MRPVWHDLLLGLRALRKEPASAVITCFTLALGIGLCTTAFSLLYGVFFRGLDVPEPGRLTLILRANPSQERSSGGVPVLDFHDYRELQTSFEGLANFGRGTVNLAGSEGPERFNGAFVSANLFELLRVKPIVGTTFRPGDDAAGAPLTVVLGYQTWATRYRADPEIAGKSVVLNGEAATILGVMPKGFRFPQDQELWVARRDERATNQDRSRSNQYQVFGRLKDGVSLDQAGLDLARIADRLAQAYPQTNKGWTTRFRSFVEDDTGPELVAVFGAMQVSTIFVLLIAIANVANLLMARATLRTREAAVRTALGASRFRVVLPFFAETLVLAVIGAALGGAIAYAGVTLFDGATQNVGKPYYMIFALDLPVLLFVAGSTLVTALLAGAAPAFFVLKTDVNATLKDEVRGSGVLGGRLTRVLVAAEIALSCALLIGAGLEIRSIVKLRNVEYPFAVDRIFTARVGLFETEYPDTAARRGFFRTLEQRLAALPGARAAALTTSLPLSAGRGSIAIAGESYAKDTDYPQARSASVTPGYFSTFGVRVLRGRGFNASDDAANPKVAIVTQGFADRFFAKREVLGQRFAERESRDSLAWITIVGLVPDQRMEGFGTDRDTPWGYFVPLAQRDPNFVSIAIQTASSDPLSLTRSVREAVRAINPNLPIYNVDSMRGVIHQEGWFYIVFGILFIVFGAAAFFMATVGLYGVLSFSVSRRMKEMGIRMALGASARDVIRLVLRQGGTQLGFGLVIGLLLAFGLTRVIGILMFEVEPRDPPVFVLVVLTIAGVGLLASLVPARRATRTHPVVALRSE